MKVIILTSLVLFCSSFGGSLFVYEVECGENAQFLNGIKICSQNDDVTFMSLNRESNYKEYNVFHLKVQNIGYDTLQINPQNISLIRYYEDRVDTVFILNPEKEIRLAESEIAQAEKDIESITKTRNTQNTTISIVKVIPGLNKINTNGSTSNTIYQEKLETAQRKMINAKNAKYYWETHALRANTINPMSYIENNIYLKTNSCIKAVLHIEITTQNSFDFLIVMVQ